MFIALNLDGFSIKIKQKHTQTLLILVMLKKRNQSSARTQCRKIKTQGAKAAEQRIRVCYTSNPSCEILQ